MQVFFIAIIACVIASCNAFAPRTPAVRASALKMMNSFTIGQFKEQCKFQPKSPGNRLWCSETIAILLAYHLHHTFTLSLTFLAYSS